MINDDKTKCYMFVYATSDWDLPIYIYAFSDTRSTKETKDLLKDFKGYVVCDAYSGYDSLPQQGIKVQRCMVHARRYFNDCLSGLSNEDVAAKLICPRTDLSKCHSADLTAVWDG